MGKGDKKTSEKKRPVRKHKPHCPRNPEVINGVNRYGRNGRLHHTRRFLKLGVKGLKRAGPPSRAEIAEKKKVKAQESRWYSIDDSNKPIKSRAMTRSKTTRLRASITPGTVLIILAGRFRGKRVVFLKQLPSGLLLVTGPYKINGVPLRRVNQTLVIATSTKIDVSKIKVGSIDDKLFKKKAEKKKKKKKDEKEFFDDNQQKKSEISKDRLEAMKYVDGELMAAIKKVDLLSKFLNAKFSLTNGQRPHLMRF